MWLAWLTLLVRFDPRGPGSELSRQTTGSPGNAFGWIALGIGLLSIVLVVAARRRARRSGRPHGMGSMPGGTAVGNALFDLGAILQPDRPDAAVIRRLDEEGEHDELGDGRDPEQRR
ncbi:MAG: hypothetical protein IAG13_33420 [Deltaproteobacteria bacterium]|nr:hypothetical protein [Nannocystaceae bacterium]